ncbi:MAG: leucine-rich repeat protein [Muribaculaceae bacterium]
MKSIVFKMWLAIAMLWVSVSSFAYDFEIDGIYYDITSFSKLTVTASSLSDSVEGSVTIPSTVAFSGKELKVTAIGENFAKGNTKITIVTICDGISRIKSDAFYGCSNLEKVIIPKSVTSIAGGAFMNCVSIQKISCSGVTSLGFAAFKGCKSLILANIPKLSAIPSSAFSSCSKLAHFQITCAKSIGQSAFEGCPFSSIEIPETVTYIGQRAFANCTKLKSFAIPNSVTEVGTDLFAGCTSLEEVSIGAGLSSLPWLFTGCVNLEKLRIEDSNETLTFEYCGSKTSKDDDFYNHCDEFEYHYEYESYKFSDTNLREVYIGRNITTGYCLIKQEIFDYGFDRYTGHYYYYITRPPFSYTNISKVVIGPCVTNLEMYSTIAYRYKDKWGDTYYRPQYGRGAFEGCDNLVEVAFENQSENIPIRMFSNCTNLKEFSIPNSVTIVELWSFQDCTSLNTISFGRNVRYIEEDAFSGCDALYTFNFYGTDPPSCYYSLTFSSDQYINAIVNVPPGSLSSYQSAEPWCNFWNLKEDDSLFNQFLVNDAGYLISLTCDGVCYEGDTVEQVSIYAIDGKLIYSSLVEPQQIITLPKGYYVVMVKGQTIKIMI